MKFIKASFLVITMSLVMSVAHKYYVSVTQISFVKEQEAVQIITRIDVADLELTLQERYDSNIKLSSVNEDPNNDMHISRYLDQKFKIKINTKETPFNFVGKQYDNDLVVCYLEIENIKEINTIEMSNMVLFDLFPEQKMS